MVWWRNLLSILFLYWLFMLVSKAACWCCCLFSLIIVFQKQVGKLGFAFHLVTLRSEVRLVSKDEIEFPSYPFGRFLCLLYLFSSSRILGVKQAHQCRPSPIASRCYAFYLFSIKLLPLQWVNYCFHFFLWLLSNLFYNMIMNNVIYY